MNKYQYNSWPLGNVSKSLQRPEPDLVKELGYIWSDPRDIVDIFENKIAKFAGAKYAVLTDCCSNAIFLSLKYLQHTGELSKETTVIIPKHTYASIPMQIMNAGLPYTFEEIEWSGLYQLKNTRVWDSAVRWTKDMYVGDDALQVISFQIKKRIPIGRGGVILTDDLEAAKWIRLASYDGRDLTTAYSDENHIKMMGYHYYMTPEDAARGIILMDGTPEVNSDSGGSANYPDLTMYTVFKGK